ncbi:hypothetical protein D9619_000580 [Psilocybe cf. subviscida]|uniref:SET domain-containing protein n=1 Tax=Psilocybe cf. subviscida TaxID=2480587 RepID=A0A8H5F2Y4_9AGAR|nr:hypothetical protein D9619_000580 [Psilocybe cf. subviscida]
MPKSTASSSEPLWQRSPSPEEDFSGSTGAERDGTWTYEILGEEVDYEGKLIYEVRWEKWERPDGTKTTWHSRDDPDIDASSWEKHRKEELGRIASKSLEINIQGTTDFSNSATYERHQALNEKLAIARKNPPNQVEEMMLLMEYHERMDKLEAGELPAPSPEISAPSVRASKRLSSRHQSIVSSSVAGPSRSPSAPTTSSLREQITPKRKHIMRSESVVTDKTNRSSSASDTESDLCQLSRADLQHRWSRTARTAGAAPITIVNLVDNEEIPRLSSSFVYLEASYRFADDVERPPDEGFLMTCDCEKCEDADICGCQGESLVVDFETKSKIYAYAPSGRFKFNVARGVEVIECNKYCNCGPSSCPNRVSQKPRNVPIEIFKTDERGWGVRSSVHVKKGKVLGVYTGLLIESYMGLSDDASMYIFDLDGDEHTEAEDYVPHQLYSVDAMHQGLNNFHVSKLANNYGLGFSGNWTRFINHSCGPNLQVYLVVHDIPSGIGMPFIAFVASDDIPAMTEFTLDYDPKAAEQYAAAKAQSKGKKKAKQEYIPSTGDHRCSCSSPDCRGYMP